LLRLGRIGRRAVLIGSGALLGAALVPVVRGTTLPAFFTDGTDFHDPDDRHPTVTERAAEIEHVGGSPCCDSRSIQRRSIIRSLGEIILKGKTEAIGVFEHLDETRKSSRHIQDMRPYPR
jgi:hypothetical protein